jgi:hypothetical protein
VTRDDGAVGVRPSTRAWVQRHLAAGERIVGAEVLHGGITADVRRLIIGTQPRHTRDLVLRSVVDPRVAAHAEDWLTREAAALSVLAGSGVPAPELVAVDPTAAHCEHPSLLMTRLPGRPVLDDEGLAERVGLLARQLVAIHALRPTPRPREYVASTTADTVVVPDGADPAVWAAAIDLIRKPAPPYEGRFLHRDFQPGNVLFDAPPAGPIEVAPEGPDRAGSAALPAAIRITGVVDWAGACWGPTDLDVAHCSTNLALLHGPDWGLRFPAAYERAGGELAATARDRRYWAVRDAMACSEGVTLIGGPWRQAGRTELTTRAVQQRLDAYVTALLATSG